MLTTLLNIRIQPGVQMLLQCLRSVQRKTYTYALDFEYGSVSNVTPAYLQLGLAKKILAFVREFNFLTNEKMHIESHFLKRLSRFPCQRMFSSSLSVIFSPVPNSVFWHGNSVVFWRQSPPSPAEFLQISEPGYPSIYVFEMHNTRRPFVKCLVRKLVFYFPYHKKP